MTPAVHDPDGPAGEDERAGIAGMTIAVLGPGGVGGLMAGVLARAGTDVIVVAQQSTAQTIAERGLQVRSVMFGA